MVADEATARLEAAQAALDRLDELEEEGAAAEPLRRLRELYRTRFAICVAVLGGGDLPEDGRAELHEYGAMRRELIAVERASLLALRNEGRIRTTWCAGSSATSTWTRRGIRRLVACRRAMTRADRRRAPGATGSRRSASPATACWTRGSRIRSSATRRRAAGHARPRAARRAARAGGSERAATSAAACAPSPCSTVIGSLADPPADAHDAYLRLHLLSHRLVRRTRPNLDGIFGVLSNVAWTTHGPVDPGDAGRRADALPRGAASRSRSRRSTSSRA